MRKQALLLLTIFTMFFSCKKDEGKDRDIIPPVVTINGNSTDIISLNTAYPDSGATAFDNADGNIAVTSDYSAKNPNVDSIGTYQITYTAKDNNGNKGYGYRTVIVQNEAQSFEGNYIVTSISNGDTTSYNQHLWIDKNLNNRVHFSDLGNYSNNSKIFAVVKSNGQIEIPLQYTINIGNDMGQPCDVVNHSFESTNGIVNGNGFTIEYIDKINIPSSCQNTVNIIANFVKQ